MALVFNPADNSSPIFRKVGFNSVDMNLNFISALKTFGEKGNLVYEYNPLRNLRFKYDLYKLDALGRLLNNNSQLIKFDYNGEEILLTSNNIYNLIESNILITVDESDSSDIITEKINTELLSQGKGELVVVNRAGTLLDFETNMLNFNLNSPVSIECQPSYDGSVNLILNDDFNPPKLVNSRFIPLESNTYKIANRKDNNSTNIYDDHSFEVDTSLYKRITQLPVLDFVNLKSGGNVKCGNYTFYFKYADSDGNETDFVAESHKVVCYIGNINDPFSIRGGLRDENSNKMIHFSMSNIDASYNIVTVYFTRSTSDVDGTPILSAGKIDKNFTVNSKGSCEIIITGFEHIEDKTIEDINVLYNIVDAVKTLAQVLNMLFMGNVHKPEIPYKELADLSLRVYPTAYLNNDNPIGYVDSQYVDKLNGEYEYYNPKNIYDKVSYWDNEIYRFGIVYILNDYTLSPVFDIRGRDSVGVYEIDLTDNFNKDFYTAYPVYKDSINPITGEKDRNYIEIGEDFSIGTHTLENSKGVVRFNLSDSDGYIINNNSVTPLGVRFMVPEEVFTELNKYCKGYFIVRQKRIPTILAQALTIGLDKNAFVPLIPIADTESEPQYITERFVNNDLTLDSYFSNHIYKLPSNHVDIKAAICPEAEIRQPLFTQLFTGSNFSISESKIQPINNKFFSDNTIEGRSFYVQGYTTTNTSVGEVIENVKLTLVEDNIKIKTSGSQKYSSRAGEGEEAWRLSHLYKDNNNNKSNNIIRGSWGTYLGIENYSVPMRIINIHIPGYNLSLIDEYFLIRYDDVSPYFPVTQRTALTSVGNDFKSVTEEGGTTSKKYKFIITYGGDCFVSNFTHRIMRNFQDIESPTNDLIIDVSTFKNNYSLDDETSNNNINRGDVNAVKLGHWVTFKCLSNVNLNLRDINESYYTEIGLTGSPRGFYPLLGKSTSGNDKIPESNVINGGISSTTSEKYNYIVPDVPYIKNEFDTRIIYSDIHINDAFKNGYRVFRSNNYRDYTKEYGAIIKLVSWLGNIVCVFEHGVAIIPVNERVLSGSGPGGDTFINTSNVLPDNPRILSSNFGSGWQESIINTENFIYGIDTVAKKIWRTNGETFEIISDFKILKFLNDNITLKERELTPTIGVRNVKTHYNAFKKDIMFTFYDDLYGVEENVWSICFNEILNKWITFYSWLPSSSENIDNIYFSFDRNTSKWISKLGKSNKESTSADGIVLSNVVFEESSNTIGEFSVVNRNFPIIEGRSNVLLSYELLEDPQGNYKRFEIEPLYKNVQVGWNSDGTPQIENKINGGRLKYTSNYETYMYYEENVNGEITKNNKLVYTLNIKVNPTYILFRSSDSDVKLYTDGFKTYSETNGNYFTNSVAVTPYDNLIAQSSEDLSVTSPGLTTDFWKHGQAGIFNIADEILPTKWYGKVHPFEFEFIVADNPFSLKIFSNLYLISNKAEPESFHFEVVGEGYDFMYDKQNIYYRQELTKEMFQQSMNKDIVFNRNYLKLAVPKLNIKSAFLPLYYDRVKSYDDIYNQYLKMTSKGRDYLNLSGGEIVWDNQMNEFKVLSHQKAQDIKKYGRLRGNMQYKEDVWNVEIRPINFLEKNELIADNNSIDPNDPQIPIIISRIPNYNVPNEDNPNDYPLNEIPFLTGFTGLDSKLHRVRLLDSGTTSNINPYYLNPWSSRKESRLRDKYIRIKVRYSGKDLAVISALKTIYINSYA